MAKFKLCPCCGGKAKDFSERRWWDGIDVAYRIKCTDCGMRTEWFKTKQFAREAWNRRASDVE